MHPCSPPRNAQGDIHLASAGKVEGVEGHLCGGLPDALGSQQAHRLTRLTQRALPLQLQQGPQTGDGAGDSRLRAQTPPIFLSGGVHSPYPLSLFLGCFFLTNYPSNPQIPAGDPEMS